MTTPSGPISTALDLLKVTIADCAEFRTWVSATGVDAEERARARVYTYQLPSPADNLEYTPDELQSLRPFVIIDVEDDNSFEAMADAISAGSTYEWNESGALNAHFAQTIPDTLRDNPSEMKGRLANTIGQIIREIQDLAGSPGYLDIRRMRLVGVRTTEELEENPDLDADNEVVGLVEIYWGVQ